MTGREPASARDPWAKAPVGELEEPLLPRWFVLLVLALVPVAIGVFVVAFFLAAPDPDAIPAAARRPPPAGGLSHDIGAFEIGPTPPVAFDAICPQAQGLRIAGTDSDQRLLRRALAGVCNTMPSDAAEAIEELASREAVVRFAAFEATGVDSVIELDTDEPRLLVNARFVQAARPGWIAPLIVHDAIMYAGDAAQADTALAAREAEAEVCRSLLGEDQRSRGCQDAEEVVGLPDPLEALRAVGYE